MGRFVREQSAVKKGAQVRTEKAFFWQVQKEILIFFGLWWISRYEPNIVH